MSLNILMNGLKIIEMKQPNNKIKEIVVITVFKLLVSVLYVWLMVEIFKPFMK